MKLYSLVLVCSLSLLSFNPTQEQKSGFDAPLTSQTAATKAVPADDETSGVLVTINWGAYGYGCAFTRVRLLGVGRGVIAEKIINTMGGECGNSASFLGIAVGTQLMAEVTQGSGYVAETAYGYVSPGFPPLILSATFPN